MTPSHMILLYVDDPSRSAAFYSDLLAQPPTMGSPNFYSFVTASGFTLCLWSRHKATPTPTAAGGGAEVLFVVADTAAVDAKHADWKARGLEIAQPPLDMDFGRTFVALDPDGHRLRVCLPDE